MGAGELAQMVERLLSMCEVAGYMPAFSRAEFYKGGSPTPVWANVPKNGGCAVSNCVP